MENGDVIELLDTLYSMISEAWGVPLGNDKCIIEREKALDIITEIKATMPASLSEAKRLVAARDEFCARRLEVLEFHHVYGQVVVSRLAAIDSPDKFCPPHRPFIFYSPGAVLRN